MMKESLFSWQHPLTELSGISMSLFNIRSWNGHLEHFLSDKIYLTYSSLFCFTETNINNSPPSLALCYNINTVNISGVIDIPSILEVLPIVLEIKKETLL